MGGFLIGLLILWALISVTGFVIKGLLWLAIIGIVLFIGTAAWGFLRGKTAA